MAGRTPRFSFNYFGGMESGSLTDDQDKYTSIDRLVLDQILATFEVHSHGGIGERVVDPSAVPTLSVASGGGQLGAGETYYYVVTFVDRHGLETASSDETSVATPAPLEPPNAVSVTNAEGGSLAAGVYYYCVSIVIGNQQTPPTAPLPITVLSGTTERSVVVDMQETPPEGASWRLWRQASTEPGWTNVGDFDIEVCLDDGSVLNDPCPTLPGHGPVQVNTTNANNAVTVTLSDADQAYVGQPDSPVTAWRIYRSLASGTYDDSLVHEVVETTEFDSDALIISYVDIGTETQSGVPPQRSQALQPALPVPLATGATLPTTLSQLPEGSPFFLTGDSTLWVLHGGAWVQVGGGTSSDVVLVSPSGYHYQLEVDDAGVLATTLVQVSVPGAPTGLSVVAGDGEAEVSFTAPASDGGGPIGNYRVLGDPDGEAEGGSSPITVSGLTNGVVYVFTVAAHNAAGWGPESTVSDEVTPAPATSVPDPPTIGVVAGLHQSVSVAFTPAESGSTPTGYRVELYDTTADAAVTPVTGTESPIVVTGLTNGHLYTVAMCAYNGGGDSAMVYGGAAVTPVAVPAAVTDLTAVATDLGAAEVSWTAAADHGATIDTHFVETYPGVVGSQSVSASPADFTDLPPGPIRFRVLAHNTNGYGPAAISNEITVVLSYPDTVMTDSPLFYLRLDDTSGTTAVDTTSNGLDGTYAGSTYTLGQSALFAGATAAVAFDHSGAVTVAGVGTYANSNAFSIEAWVKVPSGQSGGNILAQTGATDGFFGLHLSSGVVELTLDWDDTENPTSWLASDQVVDDGTAHHVVVTVDVAAGESGLKIYIDGVADIVYFSGAPVGTLRAVVGSQPIIGDTTGFWSDPTTISDVAYYTEALSAAQIATHYLARNA